MDHTPSKPTITTIIPTYCRSKLLKRAIESVLNQTYPHFKVCVYDNASDDETAELVAEIVSHDSRVKYHRHPENIGAIQNFNYGITKVNTPFFSLLSDDNILLLNFYEDAIVQLNKHPEAILFAGQTVMVNEQGQKVSGSLDYWNSGLIHPPDGLINILEKGIPNWEGVLFRKDVIDSVGLLNPSYYGAADQDFMMNIARKHVFYISKKPCATFLCHKDSWSYTRDILEVLSTLEKRLRPFLVDEELTECIRARIEIVLKCKTDYLIRRAVFCNYFVQKNTAVLKIINERIRINKGISFKTHIIVTIANFVKYNRFLHIIVSFLLNMYYQLKSKIFIYKKKKRLKKINSINYPGLPSSI